MNCLHSRYPNFIKNAVQVYNLVTFRSVSHAPVVVNLSTHREWNPSSEKLSCCRHKLVNMNQITKFTVLVWPIQ